VPKGYAGRILRVNLTENRLEIEEPPDSFYRRYVGGNGFVGYYLLREVPRGADPLGPRGADPLGPDNLLILAAGPITGVPVAGAGRHAVGGKSPLTGGYGEADVGGFFGAEMKHAGFDAILITGRSQEAVYLWVHDGEAEIRSAEHLWGMSTLDCQLAIQAELGDHRARIATIGPGGERLVRYACVIHDLKHAAGRTGMGAVMGDGVQESQGRCDPRESRHRCRRSGSCQGPGQVDGSALERELLEPAPARHRYQWRC